MTDKGKARQAGQAGLHPLETVVLQRQCIGCGICRLIKADPTSGNSISVEMVDDDTLDHKVPRVSGWGPGEPAGSFVCPGQAMDMPALARARYGREPADPMLGEVVSIQAAYATDPAQRRLSASGGIITPLLRRLFRDGSIDAVYTVVTDSAPRNARGRILTQSELLEQTHGSVYHPVDFGSELEALAAGTARFAFVGLPCQIAALESLKGEWPELAQRHVLSIGLFCGGINTFRGVDYYLRGHGVRLDDVDRLDYRYGDWPGHIRLETRAGDVREIARIRRNTRYQILRYVIAFQGYWMLPRCRICPDQISDFADIAVGDPHLPRFRQRGGLGFSAVVTRTQAGERLLRQVISDGEIGVEPLSRDELIESQGTTLDNRRRAKVYADVWRKLGQVPPRIETYAALEGTSARRHRVYAWVDLVKLLVPRRSVFDWLRMPWQIFEYTFITFAPALILKRIGKLLRNRGD